MKTLVTVLLISMATTAQAGGLSQLAMKVPRSLQQAVAVVVCATACLVGFNLKAEGNNDDRIPILKEWAYGVGSSPGHLFIAGKLGIDSPGDLADGSLFNLDALATFNNESSNGFQSYLEHLDAHFFRIYIRPEGTTYSQANRLEVSLSSVGFDYYDKRSFALDGGTEGFRAGHLHWMGLDSPILISKVGVGSLGLVNTGWFEQDDLEAWAGDEAEFSYWFFLTNGINVALQRRHSDFSFGLKILQSRTVKGDIDFADGTDGDFGAIWEIATVDAELSFLKKYWHEGDVRLGAAVSAFRQRLNANDETGGKFSQRKSGVRIAGHMGFYFD